PAPTNPVDVAVKDGQLYVIDATKAQLWHRPLVGGPAVAWSAIPLPTSLSEYIYGDLVFPHPAQPMIFFPRFYGDGVLAISTATYQIVATITGIFHPYSIAFNTDASRIAILSTGVAQVAGFPPSQNVWLVDGTTLAKLFPITMNHGIWALDVLVSAGDT